MEDRTVVVSRAVRAEVKKRNTKKRNEDAFVICSEVESGH